MVEYLILIIILAVVVLMFVNQRKAYKESVREVKNEIERIERINKLIQADQSEILHKVKMIDKEIYRSRKKIDSLIHKNDSIKGRYNKLKGKYELYNTNELQKELNKAFPDPRDLGEHNKPVDRASDN